MSKRVGIIQSSFVPWKGYFDFIDGVDEFVLLDDVQYVRRDWRNRNLIKTKDGLKWLTIPVETKGHYESAIDEISVSGSSWIDGHLSTLRHTYGRSPYFREVWPWLENLYQAQRTTNLLSDINEAFLRAVCAKLEIATSICRSREFAPPSGKNERLRSICLQLGATEYVSGPAARHYIDTDSWNAQGIAVRYKSYEGYPEYQQLYPPFEHRVTILDVLFNCGEDAKSYIKSPAYAE